MRGALRQLGATDCVNFDFKRGVLDDMSDQNNLVRIHRTANSERELIEIAED